VRLKRAVNYCCLRYAYSIGLEDREEEKEQEGKKLKKRIVLLRKIADDRVRADTIEDPVESNLRDGVSNTKRRDFFRDTHVVVFGA
jgi:hypothetical protein